MSDLTLNRKRILIGTRFNIYVKSRSRSCAWKAIHLEVVDDDTPDGIPSVFCLLKYLN
jgi:hypothetical protein